LTLCFIDKVRELTDEMADIALLNASVGCVSFELTAAGHEKMVQVNVLSNALLALEMLHLLEKTASVKGTPSRLTIVGSFTQLDHSLAKSPISRETPILSHFDDPSKFNGMARYSDSKPLTTIFFRELAQHVDRKSVVVNEVSPGMVATDFGASYPFLMRAMFSVILGLRARNLAEGVKTYLHALDVVGEESHGEYLSDNKVSRYV
jgi:NAD(P)-dependent dehydrogenase (short-subunit alcohol dehydrogenase family)